MKGAFNIEIWRSIRGSLGRFIAIAGIVALGCGFYAGLRMTAPDMDMVADAYYDATHLMDIRVVSTLGLTEKDIDTLRNVEGVSAVEPAYETDVMATIDGEQYAVRVHSLVEGMNQLEVAEGRLPEAPGECVLSADKVMATNVPIGGKIHITDGTQDPDDTLVAREYTVVGYTHAPYYVSSVSMGVTTIGSGTIQQYMYVPETDFNSDLPFTEAFIEVAGASDEFAGSDAYQERVDAVTARIEALAPECEARRVADLKADAQAELDDARAEYESERADAESELNDAKAKLDDAAATIATSESDIAKGQQKYDDGTAELAKQRKQAESKLADAQKQIDSKREELSKAGEQLAAAAAQLNVAWQQAGMQPGEAQAAIAQLEQAIPQLEQAAALGVPGAAEQLATAKMQLAQLQQLATSQQEYDKNKAAYDSGAAQLEQAEAQLKEQRENANKQFAKAEKKLDSAAAELADGRAKLSDGRAEYEQGKADWASGRAEADEKFADAERELADAQKKVDEIDDLNPEWLIMDRTKNHGVVSFKSDAERVDNIASVFPFIFFLVAALVALTTMTRMVDEERVLIGTFKALGYSRARITSKYLIYAAVASGVGAALGIVALSLILPPVIMEAYAIIYYVPHGLIMPINLPIAALSAGLGVGITLVATWFAATSTLRENPAQLMLPRAPKAGKRILLERVRPVWRRLSFSWKVTFRNLFRYKKRFVMTVIGIAGCTALLLTGLGLQDSINDIIDKQFGATVHYNVVVTFEDEETAEAAESKISELCEGATIAAHENIKPISPEGKDFNASLIVPDDPAAFEKLWVLRERVTGQEINLGNDGVVINEKLATELNVKPGDTITLAEQDEMGNAMNDRFEFTLTGVMENYIANYVFLGKQIYEQKFDKAPEYTAFYGVVPESTQAHEEFADAAMAIKGVKTVAFNDETIDTYRTMLRSVNMIVVVLVVAAAALAFIVLYNLTNINITERQREIATLKVLGFTPREVDMYIYREIILLTIIGALFGLVLGVFLEGFVITTAEVDYVMFGRDIHPTSFVVGFFLTIVFAIFVMLAMRKKLSKINMVESLKSNE